MSAKVIKIVVLLLFAAAFLNGYYYLIFKMHPPAPPTMTRTKLASKGRHPFSIKPESRSSAGVKETNAYVTTTLSEFLQSNSRDILSSTKELVPNHCSDLKNDDFYRRRIEKYLKAWHKFVPPHKEMDSSNCWRAGNMESKTVSTLVKSVDTSRYHEQYKSMKSSTVSNILTRAFTSGNRVNISTAPKSDFFCLPKVYLMGFAKTGTTSIYTNLASHPLLAEPERKEPHFWREFMIVNDPRYRELAVLSYLNIFSGASHMIGQNPNRFTIDASVYVVCDIPKPLNESEKDACTIPLIISQTMPENKLIVSVRNPTERLWSEYLYLCRPGMWEQHTHSKRSAQAVASLFHNYTLAALEEFKACIESGHSQFHCTAITGGSQTDKSVGCRSLKLGMSMYYMLLITWFHVFPREQILVTRLEDLSFKPSETMAEIWDFLDLPLDRNFHPKVAKQSPWSNDKAEKEIKMFPETRKLLDEFYHPYNVKLAELLGDSRFLWDSY